MNKLFYIIYNAYYKNGEYKNDNPQLTVGGLFVMVFFSISLSLLIIIGWINPLYNIPKVNKLTMLLITIILSLIVYFLFYFRNKNNKIYEEYKANTVLNSHKAKQFGFFIVFFIILSPIFLLMIKTKIQYGWWIKIE